MKVLQIGGTFVAAQEKIELAIHKKLLCEGDDSNILYAIGNSNDKKIIRYENEFDSFVRRLLRKLLGKKPSFSRLSTYKLISYIKKINPDLVNLHILHHGYLDYILLLEFLADSKIPVVFTLHDMWAFTGGCYYYTAENCDKFIFSCENCPASAERLDNSPKKCEYYRNLKKDLFERFDKLTFVAVSDWVASEAKKSFLSEYDIRVIENGIDVPETLPKESVLSENNVVRIISVATWWDERKGIHRIFETARLLGDGYRFDLVGSASDDIMAQAPENVSFLGYVNDKNDLIRLYFESDVHLSASLEETFGMTFIEAAFAGTRSIGYASTAITGTLLGVKGIAVSEYTPEALAKAIKETSDLNKCKLSVDEINEIIDRYSSETMADKYLYLYKDILR